MIMISAIGESKKQSELIKYVTTVNRKELIITKIKADFAFTIPLGISLVPAVLGFALSISLSIYRLNAMAADRAKIIHSTTYIRITHSKLYDFVAKKNPINAKGIAKIVWLNFIKER